MAADEFRQILWVFRAWVLAVACLRIDHLKPSGAIDALIRPVALPAISAVRIICELRVDVVWSIEATVAAAGLVGKEGSFSSCPDNLTGSPALGMWKLRMHSGCFEMLSHFAKTTR